MSKKKKKSKQKYDDMGFVKVDSYDIKKMDKQFNKVMKEIEAEKISIFEADKKDKKSFKKKKQINREEQAFLSSMRGIKKRKKVIKKWKKNGMFKKILDLLQEGGRAVKRFGKCVAQFILLILSLDIVRSKINNKTLNLLTTIFQIAITV